MPADAPIAGSRSKKSLVIAIGVGAIAIGIVVAVLVSRGGGSKEGLASKDDIATKAIAALQAGDLDGLMALTPPDKASFVHCADKPDSELAKARDKLRKHYDKLIDKAKGVEVELVKLDGGKTEKMDASDGCTFDGDVTIHTFDVSLKLTAKGATRQEVKQIVMVEGGGRWFLLDPPRVEAPGDCVAATRAMRGVIKPKLLANDVGEAAIARIDKAIEQHCNDDGWPDDAIACFGRSKSIGDNDVCLRMMTAGMQDKLRKHLDAIVDEDQASRAPPSPSDRVVVATVPDAGSGAGAGSNDGSAAGSGSGAGSNDAGGGVSDEIPSVCDDYREQLDKLKRCRRVPARVRRGFEGEYALIVKSWKTNRKTDSLRTGTEKVCATGVESVRELRKTHCR